MRLKRVSRMGKPKQGASLTCSNGNSLWTPSVWRGLFLLRIDYLADQRLAIMQKLKKSSRHIMKCNQAFIAGIRQATAFNFNISANWNNKSICE